VVLPIIEEDLELVDVGVVISDLTIMMSWLPQDLNPLRHDRFRIRYPICVHIHSLFDHIKSFNLNQIFVSDKISEIGKKMKKMNTGHFKTK